MTSSDDDYVQASNNNNTNNRRMNSNSNNPYSPSSSSSGIEIRLLMTSRDAGAVIGLKIFLYKKKNGCFLKDIFI